MRTGWLRGQKYKLRASVHQIMLFFWIWCMSSMSWHSFWGKQLCLKVFLFLSVLDRKGEISTKNPKNMLLSEVSFKRKKTCFLGVKVWNISSKWVTGAGPGETLVFKLDQENNLSLWAVRLNFNLSNLKQLTHAIAGLRNRKWHVNCWTA